MSKIVKPIPHTVDLNEPVKKTYIDTLLATEDNLAHRFDITLIQGVPSDAAVTAYFIRYSDNVTVPIKNGAVNGNVASVTLSKVCYNKPGQFAIIIKVTADGVTNTVFYGEGTIFASTTDIIVDEENVIPSLADLLAQIAAMETATANAKAEAANAKEQAQEAEEATRAISGWVNATATARSVDPDEEANLNLNIDENGNHMEFMIPRGQPGVQVSSDEPTNPNVTVWIKPDGMVDENGNVVDLAPVYSEIDELKDVKASVIMDTSAKAASHELHAQDGRLSVTLYGATTETGRGEKSPDNPYTISGVDAAWIHAGSRNLFSTGWEQGTINASGVENDASTEIRTKSIIPVMPGVPYALWRSVVGGSVKMRGYSSDGTYIGSGKSVYTYLDGSSASNPMGTTVYSTVLKFLPGVYGIRFCDPSNDLSTQWTMVQGETPLTAYEPYNANVINAPLLPDGAPLIGNGTVCDTIEPEIEPNVLSGCDKKIVRVDAPYNSTINACIFSSSALTDAIPVASNSQIGTIFCNAAPTNSASNINSGQCGIGYTTAGVIYLKIDGLNSKAEYEEYFAANPLTVYYKSTDYTPENDLRVCKVERNWKTVTLDGSADENYVISGNSRKFAEINLGESVSASSMRTNYLNYETISLAGTNTTPAFYSYSSSGVSWVRLILPDGASDTVETTRAYLQENPLKVVALLSAAQTYMTDPLPLRKPSGMEAVTVTGSGETAVTYPHDTKHYIDSKISELVTLALANQ